MKLIGPILLFVVGACSRSEAIPPGDPPALSFQAADNGLMPVPDRSRVCMVNDRYMGKPQIPVPVDGKTYFGCCAMCKEKLETTPGVRTANDPVSNTTVDKASAIIARDATGKVYYFENESTLARFGR